MKATVLFHLNVAVDVPDDWLRGAAFDSDLCSIAGDKVDAMIDDPARGWRDLIALAEVVSYDDVVDPVDAAVLRPDLTPRRRVYLNAAEEPDPAYECGFCEAGPWSDNEAIGAHVADVHPDEVPSSEWADYEALVLALGTTFHPDTRGADYESLPAPYAPVDVDRIVQGAFASWSTSGGEDPYAVAADVLGDWENLDDEGNPT